MCVSSHSKNMIYSLLRLQNSFSWFCCVHQKIRCCSLFEDPKLVFIVERTTMLFTGDIGQTTQNREQNWPPSIFSPKFAQIAITSSIPIPQLRNWTNFVKKFRLFQKLRNSQFLNWGIATCQLTIVNRRLMWIPIPKLRNHDSSIAELALH